VKPEPGVYSVNGLNGGSHAVRLEVVTESQGGPDSFGGFALPADGKILKPQKRVRQIEFIGDSHTVGYGNTSQTRECSKDDVWKTTDNSQAFGALTAKHYNADYQINAISGHGIVRNYNGFAGDPVPVAYPYVLFDKRDRYEDRSWQPQIIVIALGTNDFSTPLNAGERWKSREELHADYEKTYTQFVQSLRKDYPRAYFLLWATDAANGEIQSEVKKVVHQLTAASETKVAFTPVNGLSMSACNWHPSIADDQLIAGKLMEFIDANPKLWQGR
jgi:lysophospholipase L1-like esterase